MTNDTFFSLGLGYSEILELSQESLGQFLSHSTREEIINWLQWNDPNGIYSDKLSISEIGEILSKEEGIEIIKRQVLES